MTDSATHLTDTGLPADPEQDLAAQAPLPMVCQVLTFKLAGEIYAISITEIVEILKYKAVTPVPQAAAVIHGIVSVRGRIITVVDARQRLGLETGEVSDASRIIVLRHGQESVGLLVDEVMQVEKISADGIAAPPSTLADASQRGIAGICDNQQDSILILLEREAFLKF